MIKVIHVISDTNIGGAGRLLINYLKHFDKSKFDISVVIPSGSLLKPEIIKTGFKAIEIDGIADKSMDFSAIGKLKALFKAEKPDIVHTHSSMSAKIASYLTGVPSRFYTRHCAYDPPKYMTVFPFKNLNGFVNMTLANHIVAVADAAKENLTDTGIKDDKVTVIINGVDKLNEIDDSEKAALKAHFGTEGYFTAGIVARLEDVKGHDYFIDAAKIVYDKGYDIKFLIVGTGSEENRLKEKVKNLSLENNVIFTGFLNDVTPVFNIMDLNINCSYGTETSSLALSEGFSIGKPAVASRYGGNPYMITEGVNGFLTPVKDCEKLAEYIIKISEDKDLYKKLSDGARRLYEEKFTAEAMTKQLEVLYEKAYAEDGRKQK